MYPRDGRTAGVAGLIAELRATMPEFVAVLLEHRPPALRGRPLGEVLPQPQLRPGRAAGALRGLAADPGGMAAGAADAGLRRPRPGPRERAALARSGRAGCCGG